MMTKVSILMNGYNSEKYLKEAIDSIYSQTFKDWEIIFVDNCSTDRTKEIVDSYDNKIKYYKTEKNIPLGAARNFGLQYCKSDFLAFLDTDDVWLPYKLKKQIDAMESNDYFMSYGGVQYINELGNDLRKLVPKNKSGYIFPNILIKNEINMQSVVIKNIDIKMREDLSFSPDYNLWLKTSAEYEICVISDVLIKYRVHSNSLTKKVISRWGVEKELTINEILEIYPKLKCKYPKAVKLAYAYAGQLKAKYYMHEGRRLDAIKELYKHKFIKTSYFLFFILALTPKNLWDYVHTKLSGAN